MPNIETPSELNTLLQQAGTLRDVVFQDLDLRPHSAELTGRELPGCMFLGCLTDDALAGHIARQGCFLAPAVRDCPFDPYRSRLYRPQDLYAGFDPAAGDLLASYHATPDYKIYASYRDPLDPQGKLHNVSVQARLARRIHDHSVTQALDIWLHTQPGERLVAIMGGHDCSRLDPVYKEVARLSRTLRRQGYLLGSGGGPGLMEATNLGSYLAPYPDEALDRALAELALCPSFNHGVGMWLSTAFRVRDLFPPREGGESLGIPTWFYGHEPPNPFASTIAKYFENSLREEGLLAIALGGIIYAPGAAGTLQEIFQDACQNYYTTYHVRSPMIFYPRGFWTTDESGFPVYPVIEKLARKGRFEKLIRLVDSLDEVVQTLHDMGPVGA